jgi:hypothetical protein
MMVHQSLVLDYLMVDVLQILDALSLDEHLTLVDVVLVVIFREFFQPLLDELVGQVVVALRHQY